MKKNYILTLALFTSLFATSQDTIRFESFNLAVDSFWNGSDLSGKFTESGIDFINNYDVTYSSWDGFAYSNKKDSITAGYTNQYSCIAAEGINNSETYAVGYVGYSGLPTVKLNASANSVEGFWVNNATYAYLSMKNGDGYGKKFGDTLDANGADDGTNGNDWLLLSTYVHSSSTIDTVDFYLADFRFTDSADDYIIKDWNYVTLPANTNPDSLLFQITSTDNDPLYGIKTPTYFCLDNIEYTRNTVGINDLASNINFSVYPNPTVDYVTINLSDLTGNYTVILFDASGREIKQAVNLSSSQVVLDMTSLKKGNYFVKVANGNKTSTKKIIKL
jgi:hypothetical protein